MVQKGYKIKFIQKMETRKYDPMHSRFIQPSFLDIDPCTGTVFLVYT